MTNKVLVFSYYSNIPGSCQAEWVDDRFNSLIKMNYDILLITATCCHTHTSKKIKHLKVPALSPHAAAYEYEQRILNNILVRKNILFFYTWIMFHLNKILQRLKLQSGEGRWSWFLTAFFTALFQTKKKNGITFIYSTGGPPSAHLAALLIGKLYRKKVITEFQDPLSGEDIGRNKLSAIGLRFFEKLIIKNSTKTIYCTENAMLYSRKRYYTFSDKIDFVYPGSNAVQNIDSTYFVENKTNNRNKIIITYLGTLYQSRNIDNLLKALENILVKGINLNLHINLYGAINDDIKDRINLFPYQQYITMHGLVTRTEAIKRGMEADVLLLVQHTDLRSVTTIPFKTYDYLHTGKLIFGLIYRNAEIENILISHGHIACQADDVFAIEQNLLIINSQFNSLTINIKKSNLTPDLAAERMIQLLEN
jgi:glycosyltransferase involved in cell wall biosynthesis